MFARTSKLALALIVAATLTAGHAVAADYESKLTGTAWRTKTELDNGDQAHMGVLFKAHGKFLFVVSDAEDREIIKKVEGSYEIDGETISFYSGGKLIAQEKVLTLRGTRLVTESKSGKTTWNKMNLND
ncbi:MAG: hypothetical protein KIT69_16630 [Propionibacteriaceae bacterium]|nr:hypothetical protein [Propionibacteriaceae bacterium]